MGSKTFRDSINHGPLFTAATAAADLAAAVAVVEESIARGYSTHKHTRHLGCPKRRADLPLQLPSALGALERPSCFPQGLPTARSAWPPLPCTSLAAGQTTTSLRARFDMACALVRCSGAAASEAAVALVRCSGAAASEAAVGGLPSGLL